MQLSWMMEVWDEKTLETTKTPHAPRVRCLWRWNKGKRMAWLEELQHQLQLQVLKLGGRRNGIKCPVDDEELVVLCPSGSLHGLERLCLCSANKLTDVGLQVLAVAGCSSQLTSLHLQGL